jgi:hypothetical protein
VLWRPSPSDGPQFAWAIAPLRASCNLVDNLGVKGSLKVLLGVCLLIIGIPLTLLGALLSLPNLDKAFSSTLPSPAEVLTFVVFALGVGACSGANKLFVSARESSETLADDSESVKRLPTPTPTKRLPLQETEIKQAPKTSRLGDILIELGLIDREQLHRAIGVHSESEKSFGRTLIDLGMVTEPELVRALSKQVGLEFVDLSNYPIDRALAQVLGEQRARRYRALPIAKRDGVIVVAMSDPANVFALDEIRALTNGPVEVVVATAADLDQAIDECFGRTTVSGEDSPTEMGADERKRLAAEFENLLLHGGRRQRPAVDRHADRWINEWSKENVNATEPWEGELRVLAAGQAQDFRRMVADSLGVPMGAVAHVSGCAATEQYLMAASAPVDVVVVSPELSGHVVPMAEFVSREFPTVAVIVILDSDLILTSAFRDAPGITAVLDTTAGPVGLRTAVRRAIGAASDAP